MESNNKPFSFTDYLNNPNPAAPTEFFQNDTIFPPGSAFQNTSTQHTSSSPQTPTPQPILPMLGSNCTGESWARAAAASPAASSAMPPPAIIPKRGRPRKNPAQNESQTSERIISSASKPSKIQKAPRLRVRKASVAPERLGGGAGLGEGAGAAINTADQIAAGMLEHGKLSAGPSSRGTRGLPPVGSFAPPQPWTGQNAAKTEVKPHHRPLYVPHHLRTNTNEENQKQQENQQCAQSTVTHTVNYRGELEIVKYNSQLRGSVVAISPNLSVASSEFEQQSQAPATLTQQGGQQQIQYQNEDQEEQDEQEEPVQHGGSVYQLELRQQFFRDYNFSVKTYNRLLDNPFLIRRTTINPRVLTMDPNNMDYAVIEKAPKDPQEEKKKAERAKKVAEKAAKKAAKEAAKKAVPKTPVAKKQQPKHVSPKDLVVRGDHGGLGSRSDQTEYPATAKPANNGKGKQVDGDDEDSDNDDDVDDEPVSVKKMVKLANKEKQPLSMTEEWRGVDGEEQPSYDLSQPIGAGRNEMNSSAPSSQNGYGLGAQNIFSNNNKNSAAGHMGMEMSAYIINGGVKKPLFSGSYMQMKEIQARQQHADTQAYLQRHGVPAMGYGAPFFGDFGGGQHGQQRQQTGYDMSQPYGSNRTESNVPSMGYGAQSSGDVGDGQQRQPTGYEVSQPYSSNRTESNVPRTPKLAYSGVQGSYLSPYTQHAGLPAQNMGGGSPAGSVLSAGSWASPVQQGQQRNNTMSGHDRNNSMTAAWVGQSPEGYQGMDRSYTSNSHWGSPNASRNGPYATGSVGHFGQSQMSKSPQMNNSGSPNASRNGPYATGSVGHFGQSQMAKSPHMNNYGVQPQPISGVSDNHYIVNPGQINQNGYNHTIANMPMPGSFAPPVFDNPLMPPVGATINYVGHDMPAPMPNDVGSFNYGSGADWKRAGLPMLPYQQDPFSYNMQQIPKYDPEFYAPVFVGPKQNLPSYSDEHLVTHGFYGCSTSSARPDLEDRYTGGMLGGYDMAYRKALAGFTDLALKTGGDTVMIPTSHYPYENGQQVAAMLYVPSPKIAMGNVMMSEARMRQRLHDEMMERAARNVGDDDAEPSNGLGGAMPRPRWIATDVENENGKRVGEVVGGGLGQQQKKAREDEPDGYAASAARHEAAFGVETAEVVMGFESDVEVSPQPLQHQPHGTLPSANGKGKGRAITNFLMSIKKFDRSPDNLSGGWVEVSEPPRAELDNNDPARVGYVNDGEVWVTVDDDSWEDVAPGIQNADGLEASAHQRQAATKKMEAQIHEKRIDGKLYKYLGYKPGEKDLELRKEGGDFDFTRGYQVMAERKQKARYAAMRATVEDAPDVEMGDADEAFLP